MAGTLIAGNPQIQSTMKTSIHLLALASLASIAAASVPSEIDWPEFIGRHDLVWEETPHQ